LPVKRQDEVGQLITSVNQLLQTLAEREAASKEAQNLLGGIASRVPGMVYQFRLRADGSSCFPYSSAGIRNIYRVEPEEVREDASRVSAILHPDDSDAVAASISQSAERLTLWRHEYRVKFVDGTVRWLQGNAMPQREAGGAVVWHGFITDITERKLAEQSLASSELSLRMAMRGGDLGLWDYDLTTDMLKVNDRWLTMLGLERSGPPLKMAFCRTLIFEEDQPKYETAMTSVVSGHASEFELEIRLWHQEGHVVWMQKNGGVVERAADGRATRIAGSLKDITIRKRSELEARAEWGAATQIINAMGQGLCVTNLDGSLEFVNPAAAKLFGYTANELVGKRFSDVIAQEDAANQVFRRAERKGGNSPTYDADIVRKDRTTLRVQITGVPRFVDGEFAGAIAVLTDLTDRIRAEQALVDSEQRYRMLIELSPEAIVVHADGVVVYANPAALSLYGATTADQLVGKPIEDFVHPESRQVARERFRQMAAGAQVLPLAQLKNIKLDGTAIDIESRAVATFFAGVPAVRLSIRDVTTTNRAEAERASLEAQLRESQKMQAIGTLAGGVAHDFNNILAAILGNTELAREDSADNKRALESIDEIRKAATRARDLVQQILSFSRRQPTERKPIKLETVVEESRRLLRATLPMRLTLAVHCDKDVPEVLADATQIQQAIINLATNAMQAMPTGQGRIDIHLGTIVLDQHLLAKQPKLHVMAMRHPGHAVRLSVQDGGTGIPPENVKRIFEPFFTTKPVNEGTGLGLSVVHGIVDGHEGVIAVTSMVGVGTTFDIYLPVAPAGTVFKPSALPTITAGSLAIRKAAGLRILYLDDDEAMVFLTSRLLGRKGFRISSFSNQLEALDVVRATPNAFDVVVTDYNMPGISGVDVANEIRTIRADLPVMIASGFVDEDLQAKALAAGVKALIFKETIVEKFADAIAKAAEAV
jgi:PAS domain S-box-containing protein